MKIKHEGKQYEVEQDQTCQECGMSFYVMEFDISLDAGNDQAGYSDCPHCQNEQSIYLHETN